MNDVPSAKITAIARENSEDDLDAWKKISPHLSKTKLYDDWQEMLDKEKCDIVVIGGRYALNGQISIEAAKRGLHIISEKPVASSLEELYILKETLDKKQLKFTAMHAMRCLPVFQTIKTAVDDGLIGEPLLIHAQKSYKLGKRPSWYSDIKFYGGTILWVALHAIDFIYYCTGVEYEWVLATSSKKYNNTYTDLDTSGSLILGLKNGGSATINYDYFRPETANTHEDDRLRIVGSDGVVETTNHAEKVKLLNKNNKEQLLELKPKASYFSSFINQINGGDNHIIPFNDIFKITEIAIKAVTSAQSGKPIKV
jgi:predicted dehydrogenase